MLRSERSPAIGAELPTDPLQVPDPGIGGAPVASTARTFLVLSTTDYDAPQFGSRQQIASRLAASGHRVLFVEVPRAIHSFWTNPSAARKALRRAGCVREIAPRLSAFTPSFVLPLYYNRATNAVNQRLLARGVRHALVKLGLTPDVVWTYWPNSFHLVRALGARASVYHCIDDFVAALAGGPHPLQDPEVLRKLERELMTHVDAVVVRSTPLAERAASCARATWQLPGGVDTTVFDPALSHPVPRPLEALPHPRIGWVGTLDDRVDVDLVARCADAFPSASFALAGPVKAHRTSLEALHARPNIHILPACRHDAVPAHLAALDVGFLPYCSGTYARALSPVKLHEMLAMGLPVVSTPIPYVESAAARLQEFPATPDLVAKHSALRAVAVAHDSSAFVAALEQWLVYPPSAPERARWRELAAECSWEAQIAEIERRVEGLLAGGDALDRAALARKSETDQTA